MSTKINYLSSKEDIAPRRKLKMKVYFYYTAYPCYAAWTIVAENKEESLKLLADQLGPTTIILTSDLVEIDVTSRQINKMFEFECEE